MTFITRKAQIEDLSSIYNLVKELAIYENEPKAVTATLKDYEINFSQNVFNAIIVEKDNEVIGMCIYYLTWSTWKGRMVYLEDFIVTEKFRKKGVGQKLFDAFIMEAKQLEAVLVKWQVLDWNEPAIKFYKKNKATIEKDWWNGKIFL